MALFTAFDTITDPRTTTAAIITRAIDLGMSEDAIEREANKANPRVWAPEACAAMGLDGSSANDITIAHGDAMVELCEVATAITAIRIAQLDTVNLRGVERGE